LISTFAASREDTLAYGRRNSSASKGPRALFDLADNASDEDREQVEELYESVRSLASESRSASEKYESLAQTLLETGKLSRALRPPIRTMVGALNEITDAQTLVDSWVEKIDRRAD
jgi:methyl-accepting chemotaxis protein